METTFSEAVTLGVRFGAVAGIALGTFIVIIVAAIAIARAILRRS